MARNILISLLLLSTLCACSSHTKVLHSSNWIEATEEVAKQYHASAERHLKPAFSQAHIQYPPKKLALLTFKQEQKLEVWAKDNNHTWTYIKTYPVLAKSGKLGPKLREFDRQIPEGLYKIIALDPFSKLHLSMKLNYPNQFDQRHAAQDGRTKLGGDIFIHGKQLSVGCIAIGDAAIEQLFVLVHDVGKWNTEVIIAPKDLRHLPLPKKSKPFWVPQLHRKLAVSLQRFAIINNLQ